MGKGIVMDALIVFEEDPVAWIKALGESIRECTLESIKKLTQVTVQQPPPSTVKKRGRPIKKQTEEDKALLTNLVQPLPTPAEKIENVEKSPTADVEQPPTLPSTAKRRGRQPKKPPTVVESKPPTKLAKQQPVEPKIEPVTVAPPASTRKRGRPAKQQEPQNATLGEALEDAYVRRLSKKLRSDDLIPPQTPMRKEQIVRNSTVKKLVMPAASKTPLSITKPIFKQSTLPATVQRSTSKRVSTDAWVTVSQDASGIAPSVLATPHQATHKYDKQALVSSLEKVESWTSKFLKPMPVPPSTIKRSARIAAKVKHPNESSQNAVSLNEEVNESPLTRAKRLDSEFIKREAFFKTFVEGSSDALKHKLESIGNTSSISSTSSKAQEAVSAQPTLIVEDEIILKPIVELEKTPKAVVPESADIMNETPLLVEMTEHEDELFSRPQPKAAKPSTPPAPVYVAPIVDEAASQRIKERQDKAVEKKKQQVEKAMLAKQPPQQKPVIAASLPKVFKVYLIG